MIVRTRSGDVELRSSEWGNSWIIPQPGREWLAGSGIPITEDTAMGLPAVSNVIRSPAEIIASLPFMVYRGQPRKRSESSWQWQLLHEQPDELGTGTYGFFYDLALSIEACQNAFVQKAKSPSRVEALYVLDPQRVRVYRDQETGEKLFDVYVSPYETRKGLTTDEILHVRGYCRSPGGVAGTSLIELHRDAIGNAVGLQGFSGDFFKNNGQPPFWFTGAKNAEQAREILALHNEQHAGQGKRWKAGALHGEIDVKSLPISMQDAQFVEANRLSVEDACRIWRWPKELMEFSTGERPPTDENAWTARMLKFYLLPRLKRIERAFAADADLFGASGLIGEFLTAALERADLESRTRAYKDARQGSWITANEVRDMENLPPHADGDSILVTPTGSAPNPEHQIPPPNPNGNEQKQLLAALLERA
jgi:HK97 family phage portal protein